MTSFVASAIFGVVQEKGRWAREKRETERERQREREREREEKKYKGHSAELAVGNVFLVEPEVALPNIWPRRAALS
jgi:hypothetical protein